MRLVFKDMPLPSHSRARDAAQAARCAGSQGKFWPFHDRLFAEQGAMQSEDFLRHAAALGLDTGGFAVCLADEKVADAIDRDLGQARALGIRSTPSFIINGRLLVGAHPIENFRAVIDEALRAPTR